MIPPGDEELPNAEKGRIRICGSCDAVCHQACFEEHTRMHLFKESCLGQRRTTYDEVSKEDLAEEQRKNRLSKEEQRRKAGASVEAISQGEPPTPVRAANTSSHTPQNAKSIRSSQWSDSPSLRMHAVTDIDCHTHET